MFDKALVNEAKRLFHAVYDDGDRLRVYVTGWEYEEAEIFRDNASLAAFLDEFYLPFC